MDYKKEVEELLMWYLLVDWWEVVSDQVDKVNETAIKVLNG